MKQFALIGAAGYVAPRHMKAIRETGHHLAVAMDPNDSVGILDSYFPEANFFTEFERFDRHVEKLRRSDPEQAINYVSICSPNYLHDAHIRFALRAGAHAICEKPLVLNPWNIDALKEIEAEYPCRIYTILQLRLHPAVQALRERVKNQDKTFDIDLTYIAARGKWYQYSWKGDVAKSGGVATNIGVHFFDMLLWIFGPLKSLEVHLREPTRVAGDLRLAKARVKWFLSIEEADLPTDSKAAGQRTFRSLTLDRQQFDFSSGFEDLHTASYREILAGTGFGLEDARPSVDVIHQIRNARPHGK